MRGSNLKLQTSNGPTPSYLPHGIKRIFLSLKTPFKTSKSFYLYSGLSQHPVHNVVECNKIMEKGWKNRSTGATLMNADSSRSHSIFTINLEMMTADDTGEEHIRAGKLNLVDLAGSERQAKTGRLIYTSFYFVGLFVTADSRSIQTFIIKKFRKMLCSHVQDNSSFTVMTSHFRTVFMPSHQIFTGVLFLVCQVLCNCPCALPSAFQCSY